MQEGSLVIFVWIFFCVVCGLIGRSKGRTVTGVFAGLLGIFGLIIMLFAHDLRRKCPHCGGAVHKDASCCCHCGRELSVLGGMRSTGGEHLTMRPKGVGAAAQPSKHTPKPVAMVPCPLCGKGIAQKNLVVGENTCPHCLQQFECE